MVDRQPERIVRPTLRCLRDDLGSEVLPLVLRRALPTLEQDMAADPSYMLPCRLAAVQHAVIAKANQIASDDNAPRELIKAIDDRHVIKVKTGDHRAALWQDDDSTWWLLAAGHRRDDGAGDFYRRIERFSRDSAPIAPSDADTRYLRLEIAYEQECAAERKAQAALVGRILAAARTPRSTHTVEIFGASMQISVIPDGDELMVLEIAWELLAFDDQDRFPSDVLAMVPGHENIESWDYLPPRHADDAPHTWYTYVSAAWVDDMATAAELEELIPEDWHPINPVSDGSEHFSHRARASVVTLAYTTGIEITGLCGARVVAHRDYEEFPLCPTCEENLALLRAAVASTGNGVSDD